MKIIQSLNLISFHLFHHNVQIKILVVRIIKLLLYEKIYLNN